MAEAPRDALKASFAKHPPKTAETMFARIRDTAVDIRYCCLRISG